jgi:hypothetical protein
MVGASARLLSGNPLRNGYAKRIDDSGRMRIQSKGKSRQLARRVCGNGRAA